MVFISLPDEVDTEPLIAGLRMQGKGVAVPHTDVATGELVSVSLRAGASLRPASLDVPEPEHLEPVAASGIDVVVIPGRAFGRSGGRVGRGKGYYDRFLSKTAPQAERIAVAYACQVFDEVPAGHHDMPVDVVVTEDEVLRPRE
jgi:5-formyltetrahydrofolate cyclo-ligase